MNLTHALLRCPSALVAFLRTIEARPTTPTAIDDALRSSGLIGWPAVNDAELGPLPQSGPRRAHSILVALSAGDEPLVERSAVGGIRDAVRWRLTRYGRGALELARGALEYQA